MAKRIRIGIVGSGGMARSRAATFSSLEGCEVEAIAARNRATGEELASEHGVELLDDWQSLVSRQDLEAVAICTSNDSHAVIARAALEAGKHVFMEYPLARQAGEAQQLVDVAGQQSGCVLRVAHNEAFSPRHVALKQAADSLGDLLVAIYVRLTPGRGSRPEVLFNLNASGPPALFFIYHVYPLVDIFGAAVWVEGYANYVGLGADGRYDSFVNTMTAGFGNGGCATWTWAGGVAINAAEEYQRLVLTEGSLLREGGQWSRSTPQSVEELELPEGPSDSIEEQFLREVAGEESGWRADVAKALDAVRISLAAEEAFRRGRRVTIEELGGTS